ncbi:unnamed protein product, partial [Brenthis ino]
MYKNYTYKYESDKRYLCCSRYRSLKCNARLVVDAEGNIVRANEKIHALPTARGGVLMFRNYTFSYTNSRKRLLCSKKLRGKCKAKLKVDDEGYVIGGYYNHNHPPPVYHKAKDGLYFKDRFT